MSSRIFLDEGKAQLGIKEEDFHFAQQTKQTLGLGPRSMPWGKF
jgi:hypothetical protein